MLDYNDDHYCPAYEKYISADLCYDSLFALNRFVKISTVKEIEEIKDLEKARLACKMCPYSDLSGELE